jgi:hypothetical protein
MNKEKVAARAVERFGTTYAEEAGITVRDKPSPLWRLLVLAHLLSARISSRIAVNACRELSQAGGGTPRGMAELSWQQRVDALGRAHYRRYDERTSTMLGEVADQVLKDYGGDLRRLRNANDIDAELQKFKGIGPSGAAIFCREVQGVWTELRPYVDRVAADGAAELGLPKSPARLAALVTGQDLVRLVAACVRAARDEQVVEAVLA